MKKEILEEEIVNKDHHIKHLAMIMDGNARWAQLHNTTKALGHKKGAEVVKNLLPEIMNLNIPYFTIYSFSHENWQRSPEEISVLLNLLAFYLDHEISVLNKNGIKLKIIGNLDRLSEKLQKTINNAVKNTEYNSKMTLCVAFSYGSRSEIVDACNKIIQDKKTVISEREFRNYLYDPEMPDVDLLIRTSGVQRISNFLLWQCAYAELYFSPKYWPDFSKNDLLLAIDDYSKRNRTFGGR